MSEGAVLLSPLLLGVDATDPGTSIRRRSAMPNPTLNLAEQVVI
ncbi:MAG: hypothetical protein QM582_10080 [Micropruina sp.]